MNAGRAFFPKAQLRSLGFSEEQIDHLKRHRFVQERRLREGDKEIIAFEADLSLLSSLRVSLARGLDLDDALQRLTQEQQKSQFLREGRMPPVTGLADQYD